MKSIVLKIYPLCHGCFLLAFFICQALTKGANYYVNCCHVIPNNYAKRNEKICSCVLLLVLKCKISTVVHNTWVKVVFATL